MKGSGEDGIDQVLGGHWLCSGYYVYPTGSGCPEVVADSLSWVRVGRNDMNPCDLSWLLAGAGVVGGTQNVVGPTLLGPTGGSWEPRLYHHHM